jgi:hypothetical protein
MITTKIIRLVAEEKHTGVILSSTPWFYSQEDMNTWKAQNEKGESYWQNGWSLEEEDLIAYSTGDETSPFSCQHGYNHGEYCEACDPCELGRDCGGCDQCCPGTREFD